MSKGKLNQDSFVVDEVLQSIVGDSSSSKKDDKKKDKSSKKDDKKKDKSSKKDDKKKDKSSNKEDKKKAELVSEEAKALLNKMTSAEDEDELDDEVEEDKSLSFVFEPVSSKKNQDDSARVENDNKQYEVMLELVDKLSPEEMVKRSSEETYKEFVEWAIENKHSVGIEHIQKSIEINEAIEAADRKSDKKDKKSKDKKSDKKDKKSKDKKDKKSKDKKSDKKDKKSKDKKSKKGKSKVTSDEDDLNRAIKIMGKDSNVNSDGDLPYDEKAFADMVQGIGIDLDLMTTRRNR